MIATKMSERSVRCDCNPAGCSDPSADLQVEDSEVAGVEAGDHAACERQRHEPCQLAGGSVGWCGACSSEAADRCRSQAKCTGTCGSRRRQDKGRRGSPGALDGVWGDGA